MTLPIPYLSFRGQAGEAMDFYHSVFGGELEVNTYESAGFPTDTPGAVMHARLQADDIDLMASDAPAGTQFREGTQIRLSLVGDASDEEKLRGWFDALAVDGSVDIPLEKQAWGDLYGDLTDRFGIGWVVNIGQEG